MENVRSKAKFKLAKAKSLDELKQNVLITRNKRMVDPATLDLCARPRFFHTDEARIASHCERQSHQVPVRGVVPSILSQLLFFKK